MVAAVALVVALVAAVAAGYAMRQVARLRREARKPPPRAPEPPGPRSLQHVGVVRFNAYHDTGGDYSFAVALLDAAGAGVLLSGLYHRDQCRVYAKPVSGWDSPYTLTDEEREAIERARTG